eukprot:5895725-Karenia_brevis.AAC.1
MGTNIREALQAVASSRIQSSILQSSARTYASHLRMILWASKFLDLVPLPADMECIRLVATCVNNSSTLRGWLAAWRLAHLISGHTWKGDNDEKLKAIRLG